jgi:hypothetical protein
MGCLQKTFDNINEQLCGVSVPAAGVLPTESVAAADADVDTEAGIGTGLIASAARRESQGSETRP